MAKQGSVLFELPIGQAGKIVVTEPAKKVYLLTFSSPPDNRLTTVSPLPELYGLEFTSSLNYSIDILQSDPPRVRHYPNQLSCRRRRHNIRSFKVLL